MASLDRRTLLKTTAASATLGVPAAAAAQSSEVAPMRSPGPDETALRGPTMGAGGLSRVRLGRMHDSDPKEDMVAILMTQRVWDAPRAPDVYLDFWTLAYQAIDD